MKYAELVQPMFHSFHHTDIVLHHQQILVLDQVTLIPTSLGVNQFHQ